MLQVLVSHLCLLVHVVQSLGLVFDCAQLKLVLHNLLVQLLNYVLNVLHTDPPPTPFPLICLLLTHHLLFQHMQRLHQLMVSLPLSLHLLIQPLHLPLQKSVLLMIPRNTALQLQLQTL